MRQEPAMAVPFALQKIIEPKSQNFFTLLGNREIYSTQS
jgi:hypothetical protein